MTLGTIRLEMGRGRRPRSFSVEDWRSRRRRCRAGHWRIAEAQSRLGACLGERRQAREAEPLLVDGYEGLLRGRGARGAKTVDALKRLVAFYEGQGDNAAAAGYRAQLPR